MTTKNIGEQIADLENTRAAKAAEMDTVAQKSIAAGETMNAEDGESFDTLECEIKALDTDIARLRRLEKLNAEKAKPVDGSKSAPAADSRNGGSAVQIERKLAPGVAFARFAGIMASAKGSVSDALILAKSTFPDEPRLHGMIENSERIKAAVAVGTTADATYASPLVYAQNISSEFIEFLRPQTIVGRIPNLRRVPFNVRVPRQTNGGAAYWTGEAAPKGVSATALDTVSLKYKKLATIAVISDELARFSTPSAELILRDTLAGAIIQQMDSDFVNPANAGVVDVRPASITNSATAIISSGTTEAAVRADIKAVFAPFIAANLTPANGVWIMSSTTALSLSLMVNSLGQPSFPGVSMEGGTLWGMPVVVSQSVGNIVILANASDIMIADDGQVTIDTSREASLQMDNAPDNPATATTVFVSLWQRNLLGIRAERYVDWVKARPAAVQYLSAVNWG
jgi:HK97 family phage major capsid protein